MFRLLHALIVTTSLSLTTTACAGLSRAGAPVTPASLGPQGPAGEPLVLASASTVASADVTCAVHTQPGCFSLERAGGQACWVPRESVSYADCASASPCIETEDGVTGDVGCYKWSGASDSPARDWRRGVLMSGELPMTAGPGHVSFYDDAGCFLGWPSDDSLRWMPAPSLTHEACQALDSCTPSGGGLSDGRCYKWGQSSHTEATPWPEAMSDDTIPAQLVFDRSAVTRDELLSFAEERYQAVGPLLIIESVRSMGVHGHAALLLQRFEQGVRLEHVPMDIDGNGAVSSRLTLPDTTDAEARAIVEGIAPKLGLSDWTQYWRAPDVYAFEGEVGECALRFSRRADGVIIHLECAAC
ncbi:MAG: hypothetical protein P8R54_25020 [Myxococcota bacterium]|nr:hypothetical protein [Myxococcota bacterium]